MQFPKVFLYQFCSYIRLADIGERGKPYFMRVSGQKNYVKYASGWKNHKKMIKYDTMIQQKIISEKTKHQPCFYTIHT